MSISIESALPVMMSSSDDDLLGLLRAVIESGDKAVEFKLFVKKESRLTRHTMKVCCRTAERVEDPENKEEYTRLLTALKNAEIVATYLRTHSLMTTKLLTQFVLKLTSMNYDRPVHLQRQMCRVAVNFLTACTSMFSKDIITMLMAKITLAMQQQTDDQSRAMIAQAVDLLANAVDTSTGVERTVHIKYIDTQCTTTQLREMLEECGHVCRIRLYGDREASAISAFLMFKTKAGADNLFAKDGCQLGRYRIQVLKATAPLKDSRLQGLSALGSHKTLAESSEIIPWGRKTSTAASDDTVSEPVSDYTVDPASSSGAGSPGLNFTAVPQLAAAGLPAPLLPQAQAQAQQQVQQQIQQLQQLQQMQQLQMQPLVSGLTTPFGTVGVPSPMQAAAQLQAAQATQAQLQQAIAAPMMMATGGLTGGFNGFAGLGAANPMMGMGVGMGMMGSLNNGAYVLLDTSTNVRTS